MRVLVTGGRGYIGTIAMNRLKAAGYRPISYDLKDGQDIRDNHTLTQVMQKEKIEAVIHFAAFIEMGESVINPEKYFENNFIGSQILVETMIKNQVRNIIFSSTAGVYGNPERVPIRENDRKRPENPYGLSKLMVEELLGFYAQSEKLRSIALRYFNAAGATLDAQFGENHQPESHLIPNVIKAILNDREFTLNGGDYPTQDGTCIRDYIHVVDLVDAHILSLKNLKKLSGFNAFNVGAGQGYSNREVIGMIEKISGKKLKLTIGPRRPGDAGNLTADSSKLKQAFNWQPQHSDLKSIIASAWRWHQKPPKI